MESDGEGELVGMDCFLVGGLHGAEGGVWQITAMDTYAGFDWADLVACSPAGRRVAHACGAGARVDAELEEVGWQLQRVLSDNGSEFGCGALGRAPVGHGAGWRRSMRCGGAHNNGHVERLHRTILEEC